MNNSEIHLAALGILSRQEFWPGDEPLLETPETNKAVDVSARVIRWTSCLNDALGGVGVAVTPVLTITRMESRVV